jgi:hypothetical protein
MLSDKFARRAGLWKLTMVLMVFAGTASAVSVSVNGSNLFFDNFESGGFSSPTGSGASWLLSGGPTERQVVSTNPPGAAQGVFYASLFRSLGETSSGGTITAEFNQQTSGTLLASFMLYLPSVGDANARANIFLEDTANFTTATAQVYPDGAGGVDFQNGSGVHATGLSYKTNTWQRWDLTYTIGNNSFGLSIDGVAAPNALTPWGTGPVSQLVFANGSIASDGFFFLDAVPPAAGTPEPGGMVGVATGVAALGWWRRRRRAV